MFSSIIFLVALVKITVVTALNDYPIIGVFTQPSTATVSPCDGDCVYLAASYVKFIESSGGRVVPINYYSSTDELDVLFESLNGFLFPGGSAEFPSTAQYIFDKVIEANDDGDYIPLYGICLGFEWLMIATSLDENVLDGIMDAENISLPLLFTNTSNTSRLFSSASSQLLKIFSTENVTMNNHEYGIWADHFATTLSLSSFYNLLSTNFDREGEEFVSTVESYDYPIWGTQWHPEKNAFEFGMNSDGTPKEVINHSYDAITVTQYMTNFFVDQARLNDHKFATEELEDSYLIYNYQPVKTSGSFVQEYYFQF